jgi:N-acetylgalactosamine-N,N'-diacetylbacillosaminyl-diphospho-undecaprenol 4-alpha-N-acetylgalactosaminyltransferase
MRETIHAGPRNIVFIINSLTAGGAEGALVSLLEYMKEQLAPFSVHLVLLDTEQERHFVPIWVKKHVLDANFGLISSTVRLAWLLKQLRPALALSFLNRANCANVMASTLLGYPCIISERVHTSRHFGIGLRALINKTIVRLTYPLADQVIAVSEGVKDDLLAHFGVPGSKLRVIHNPINTDLICERAAEAPSVRLTTPYIMGMGRLVPNKNFGLLIEAYRISQIAENLVILGDGPQRTVLESLVTQYGLSGRVILPGHVNNPYPIMKMARLYVCSSNAEGFPNALIEAMALGCPVVSTDCDTGPLEILTRQTRDRCREMTRAEYGILVPPDTPDVMASAIRTACDEQTRTLYVQRGTERVRDYSVRRSVQQYWATIAPYAHPLAHSGPDS